MRAMQTFRQADARCDNAAGQLVNKVVQSNELVINLILILMRFFTTAFLHPLDVINFPFPMTVACPYDGFGDLRETVVELPPRGNTLKVHAPRKGRITVDALQAL